MVRLSSPFYANLYPNNLGQLLRLGRILSDLTPARSSNFSSEFRVRVSSLPLLSAVTHKCIAESPPDPSDTQVAHYLMGTWAKVCQAMGLEFEPYLPVVMPGLLAMASKKADVSVYGEDKSLVRLSFRE